MKVLRRILLIVVFVLLAISVTVNVQAAGPHVNVLEVKGPVNPVLVGYIERGIQQSEKDGAEAVIILLDTPGGLDTSMRDIVQVIVSSNVPVVVYVYPSGSRAASAGVFIAMAAHVAVMAPNTAIGAAHPVAIGEDEMPEGMMEKVVNDAAAYIRSIAENHGRNVEWAEQAGRESVSATEQEALSLML
jgi:membrane-bound serine protease (ClpP class)